MEDLDKSVADLEATLNRKFDLLPKEINDRIHELTCTPGFPGLAHFISMHGWTLVEVQPNGVLEVEPRRSETVFGTRWIQTTGGLQRYLTDLHPKGRLMPRNLQPEE